VKSRVLIVDDVPANVDVLVAILEPAGYEVLVATGGERALALAGEAHPSLVLLDVVMPGMDGFETCRKLKARVETAPIPVVFLTARGDTDSLLAGFEAGGVDYVTKPFHQEEVLARVRTHVELYSLARSLKEKAAALSVANRRLREEIRRRQQAEDALATAGGHLSLLSEQEAQRWGLEGFVGRSPTLGGILQEVRRLQDFPTTGVLITGESGTGKELVARALHFGSPRGSRPFIAVNCSAVPAELAESLFFGHRQGAFSGATRDRKGHFELADGGTIFLDEVGDMPAALQAKLLRVLEDGRLLPVGAEREVKVDVRVLAATNVDLARKIAAGTFRQDLYYRLARFTIRTPPLRERKDDIALLAAHFLQVFAREMGRQPPPLNPAALAALEAYDFPGNVRELKNLVERALIASNGGEIRPEHIAILDRETDPPIERPAPKPAIASPTDDLPYNLEEAERVLIRRALDRCGGNVAQAARLLGVPRMRIYRRLGTDPADRAGLLARPDPNGEAPI
jgi:DNA-binding NtrC family response regulator